MTGALCFELLTARRAMRASFFSILKGFIQFEEALVEKGERNGAKTESEIQGKRKGLGTLVGKQKKNGKWRGSKRRPREKGTRGSKSDHLCGRQKGGMQINNAKGVVGIARFARERQICSDLSARLEESVVLGEILHRDPGGPSGNRVPQGRTQPPGLVPRIRHFCSSFGLSR